MCALVRQANLRYLLPMLRRIVLTLLLLLPLPAAAAELIMFDLRGCPYCARFKAEVAPAYANSAEGRRAPLRIVDIKDGTPKGIMLKTPVTASPTFVLVDNSGREVGRLIGYSKQDFFWGLLGRELEKLPVRFGE
jgi:glutaredoxin